MKDAVNYGVNDNKTIVSKSFEYKKKVIGRLPVNNNRLNIEVVVPWKYSNNFWRSFDLLLINCEKELDFSWSKSCVICELSKTLKEGRVKPVDTMQKIVRKHFK